MVSAFQQAHVPASLPDGWLTTYWQAACRQRCTCVSALQGNTLALHLHPFWWQAYDMLALYARCIRRNLPSVLWFALHACFAEQSLNTAVAFQTCFPANHYFNGFMSAYLQSIRPRSNVAHAHSLAMAPCAPLDPDSFNALSVVLCAGAYQQFS